MAENIKIELVVEDVTPIEITLEYLDAPSITLDLSTGPKGDPGPAGPPGDDGDGVGASAYLSPLFTEADGDITAGELTFTHADLIGATELNYIIVNKVTEFVDEDFSFDNTTGTITRPYEWQAGDKMITPHKPA